MAILYNFKKEKDIFILDVEQDTTYKLYYISSNTEQYLGTGGLVVDSPFIVPITIDGEYRLDLTTELDTPVSINFTSFIYLQHSIIREAKTIICGDTVDSCKTANCLTEIAREALQHKSMFVKLLSFESLFIPTYGIDYPLVFTNFINSTILTRTCKVQSKVNDILREECITGSVNNVEMLTRLYTALYWAGMYFIEKETAGTNEEELDFVYTKFRYDEIINCLCGLCIDMGELEKLFGEDQIYTEIYSFQFDGIEYDINDVDLITPEWLEDNGTVESETSLTSGKNITYTLLGRIGFTISNNKDRFRFFDALGNDITDTAFDTVWDDTAKRQTYVSKEYYVPSTIYYKFVKL